MVASSVLANDGFEKRTPDFNPLTRHALAGAEPEKDELRKKNYYALSAFHIWYFQCFQPNKVYFRLQTFKYTSLK